MREIEFRGIKIYSNKWVYGNLIQNEKGEKVEDIPVDFNPSNYELDHCGCENYTENRMQITRDMAIDACDLSLEGQWI